MKIELLTGVLVGGKAFEKGQTAEVSDIDGKMLISMDKAILAKKENKAKKKK